MARRKCETITVHVFVGGDESVQRQPFFNARANLKIPRYNLIFEEYKVSMIKNNKWTPEQLVEWLTRCDIHMIIGHLHQNIFDVLSWNVDHLKAQLEYLYWHNGFPAREQLFCPVFLQDKFAYLRAVSDFCNPTLSIPLSSRLFGDNKQEQPH